MMIKTPASTDPLVPKMLGRFLQTRINVSDLAEASHRKLLLTLVTYEQHVVK